MESEDGVGRKQERGADNLGRSGECKFDEENRRQKNKSQRAQTGNCS